MERQKQLELEQQQAMAGGISGGLIAVAALIATALVIQYKNKKKIENEKKKQQEENLSLNPIIMNKMIKNPTMISSMKGKLVIPKEQQRISFGEKIESFEPTQLRKSIENHLEQPEIKQNSSKNSFIPLSNSINTTSPIQVNRVNNNTNNTISNPLEISKNKIKTNKSTSVPIQQKVEGGERQLFPAQMIRPSDRSINKTTNGGTTNYLNNLSLYQSNKRPISVRNPIKSNIANTKKNIYDSIEE
jgi:hypothetical protein